ncbi:UbiX family flavin prenyltransferase [Thermodesulfobacterium sp. TA1]|uniref:UbiX family flavin prenyltransferase n=1 Tax=Thermodesulfobacterium sp. TA1 TaxID=2234087 RepID=UPI001231C436|nr:UbiX family flavin prenyltransferase [Thermodesulfobacterium sp. TA1]QER42075.1 UbiX family flavin prenyltransferase [Thermodesulfobacterium sp. TA1]
MEKKYLVGITGASGAVYAKVFLQELRTLGVRAEVIITEAGKKVWETELNTSWQELKNLASRVYQETEITAGPASGSSMYSGMVIIPCSMGTLGAIAHGVSRNLLQRAADVMLKEKKTLVLVVRETPLNLIHLKNMEVCLQAGAVIFPAMPSFYQRPKTLEELLRFFVKRLLLFLGFKPQGFKGWEDICEEE